MDGTAKEGRRRRGAFAWSVVLGLLGVAFTLFATVEVAAWHHQQEVTAAQVNAVGRQRVLTERLLTDATRLRLGSADAADVERDVWTLRASWVAIMDGGTIPALSEDGEAMHVQAVELPDAARARFEVQLDAFVDLARAPGSPEEAQRAATELVEAFDALATELVSDQHRIEFARGVAAFLAAGGSLAGSVTLAFGRQRQRSRSLVAEARAAVLTQQRIEALSELETATADLAASDALHRFLSEHATDLMLRVGADSRIIFASMAASPMLGYAPGDLHGAPISRLVFPPDFPSLASVIAEAVATGFPARADLRLIGNAATHPVWVEATVQQVLDATGSVEHHVTMRDIEARRRAQHDLADVENRLRTILELLDEGVVLHHRELGIVEVNSAASRMLGLDAGAGNGVDQIATRLVPHESDGTPTADTDVPTARALRTARSERGRVLEMRKRDGGGSIFLEVNTVPTGFDAIGTPSMALSTFRDITEARAAADALAASETRFRLLADNTQDLVSLTDGAGSFAYASPSVESLLGYAVDDVVGRNVLDVLGREDVERIGEALASGQVVRHQLARSDGTHRWLETVARVVPDDGTGSVAVLASSRDVTDRVAAERALVAERKLLDTCLAHLHSGVLAVDRDGVVLHVNQRHLDLWQTDIRPGDSLGSLRSRTMLLDAAGETWSGPRPFDLALAGTVMPETPAKIGLDGEQLDIVISAEPIVDDDGAVTGAVITVHDVSELRAAERELRTLASIDVLTGLPNRRRLMEYVGQAVERCRRRPDKLLMCFVDLDGFKAVNDELGHDAGDELLRQVGTRIVATVRGGDFVARYGGDEFVVVAEDLAAPDDAATVASRIEQALSETFRLTAGEARIGASVGVRAMRDGDTRESMLADADRAMYARKSVRRDHVTSGR